MGSLLSKDKRMVTPGSLEEVAASVLVRQGLTIEESIQASGWGSSFSKKLSDPELKQLFVFLVLCQALTEPEDRLRVLLEVERRVFTDRRSWIPAITFRDTENRVEEIFQLYQGLELEQEEGGRKGLLTQAQQSSDTARLVSLLLALRQDRTVRGELEPIFREWVKRPIVSVQHCLLSLL